MIAWSWRVTVNLEYWDKQPKWNSKWAIGGWFTPIGFLFIPYQVVRDAWKLPPGKNPDSVKRPNLWWLGGFVLWWGSWIFAINSDLFVDKSRIESFKSDFYLSYVSISMLLVSSISMLIAIRQITNRQLEAKQLRM